MQAYQDNISAKVSGVLSPILGVSVTVTDTSTGKPAALYSDNGVTQLAQPLTTDETGYFGFYAANGRYTLAFSSPQVKLSPRTVQLYDPADDLPLTQAQAASPSGASKLGFTPAGAGAISRSVENKLRDVVSVKDFGAVGDGVADDTGAIQSAITACYAAGKRLTVPHATYKIIASLDMRNMAGFEFVGAGLPTIVQATPNTPIILAGGERIRIESFLLKFAVMPAATDTNAVCVRGYNLYESILKRLYMTQMNTGIDQFQGLVNGGQNAFYSNRLEDLRIVNFSGWAAQLIPFGGGNSGNRWENIYINNRGASSTASGSGACKGGVWLQTAQNDVFNLLNIEWMRNANPAIVLNQAGNPVFTGLHLEGLYPTTAFNPLIDIIGGDKSCPTFNALTVLGCDWTGAAGQALFRLDSQGTRVKAGGIQAYSNTTPSNMQMLTNGGSTCYGSYLEVTNANVDTSFANDAYSAKVSYGTPTAGVEIPLQVFNQRIARHSAQVSGTSAATISAGTVMTGSVASSSYDMMSLWDVANNRFAPKQSGNYTCSVTIPTGSSPIVQVKKNGTTVATITPTNGGGGSVQLSLARGTDTVQFYLASGSYTDTGVQFGISM